MVILLIWEFVYFKEELVTLLVQAVCGLLGHKASSSEIKMCYPTLPFMRPYCIGGNEWMFHPFGSLINVLAL